MKTLRTALLTVSSVIAMFVLISKQTDVNEDTDRYNLLTAEVSASFELYPFRLTVRKLDNVFSKHGDEVATPI